MSIGTITEEKVREIFKDEKGQGRNTAVLGYSSEEDDQVEVLRKREKSD